MAKFIALFGLAAVLVFGVIAYQDSAATRPARAAHEGLMLSLDYQQERRWQENQQPYIDMILVSVAGVMGIGAAVFTLAVFGGVGLAVINWARGLNFERRYAMAHLRSKERIAIAAHQYQHALPAQHYAPHITYSPHTTSKAIPGDVATVPDEQAAAAAAVPSFAELLQAGKLGKGNPLLLGYGQGGAAIEGSWLHLYSVGIGGATGSGKSWTAAYLLAQSMLHGARALVIDPHAGDPESLATRLSPLQAGMMSEPASNPRAILATVQLVQSELDRRKSNRAERVPWVVVADEFSALMRGELQEPLALLIEAIAQEGRKLGIYAMCLGQNWKVSRSGGGELRDSLASAFMHRIRPNQARYLTGLYADDLPRDLLELPPGCAYWLSTGGDLRRVSIPRCNTADLHQVAGLLTDHAPTMPRMNRQESATNQPQNSHPSAPDYSPPQQAEVYTAEEARVIALFLDGYDAAAIVKELHGITSKAGKPYMNKLAEVQAVVRRALQAKAVGE
jgi:hypothetical protein